MKDSKKKGLPNQLSLWEDFHAKTYPLQEEEQELSKENDQVFGRSLQGSSKMYSQRGQLLKMYRPFDLKDLPWSYKISTRSGTMQNGIAYPVPQLVGCTEEIAYGSSPIRWRTPDAHSDRGASSKERMKMKLEKGMPISINDQVAHRELMDNYKQSKMLPTPCARDWRGAGSVQTMTDKIKKGIRAHTDQLPNRVALEESLNILSEENRSKDLHNMPKPNGQLNPNWTEWLMGYPIGYTDLKE